MTNKEELLEKYFKEIHKIYNTGKATEPSFYATLKRLLESYFERGLANVEEKKSGINKPDFVIRKGKEELVGYIEAKDFKKYDNLDSFIDSYDEQIERYKKNFPNFILTNFFDFWLYRDGKRTAKVSIGFPRELSLGGVPSPRNVNKFFELLELFFSFSIPEKRTAKSLASELAKRAKWIPESIVEELNNDVETEIDRIFRAFKGYLISDLTKEDFADIYAQTITYGLFTARLRFEGKKFNRFLARELIPKNIQIFYDTFNLLSSTALPESLTWIVDDIATLLAYSDIKKIKEEFHQKTRDDPLMYFYETFLAEYAPKKRKARGVYYTPFPVVSYITRSINILLKEKFNKKQGFADESVTLLDPASGTLTFPANATILAKDEIDAGPNAGSWLDIVKNHVLKNYYAFELLMAPYIIGHLKISLLLEDLGYKLKPNDRFQLYLTNTLDFKKYKQLDIPYVAGLSKEAVEAHRVKEREKILVIMGNPPYSVSSHNVIQGNPDYKEVYNSYKEKVRKEEKNIQPLSDDYIKFIAFAHWKIQQNGHGVVGMITNNSYLDGLIHRDMRRKLAEAFDEIYILNLHGSSKRKETTPGGDKDENVFDIQQGVSIVFLIRNSGAGKFVKYADLWGLRKEKYKFLESYDIKNTKWKILELKEPHYFFVPKDFKSEKEYQKFISIKNIFEFYNVGGKPGDDALLVGRNPNDLKVKINQFVQLLKLDKSKARTEADKNLLKIIDKFEIEEEDIIKYNYRPFDTQNTYYDKRIYTRPVPMLKAQFDGDNICLLTTKIVTSHPFQHVFISEIFPDVIFLSNRGSTNTYVFPLYLYRKHSLKGALSGQKRLMPIAQMELDEQEKDKKSNINPEIIKKLTDSYKENINSEEIFYYIYGILYSDIYRRKYQEFLKIDFPKIPFTSNYKLFKKVVSFGEDLTELHLLKSSKLQELVAKFPITGDSRVEKRDYNEKEERIYINENQHFEDVEPEIWNYYIGGYQVLDKWLKDRVGKALSREDVDHFLKIISSLKYTIDLQKEIDKIYLEVEKKLIKF